MAFFDLVIPNFKQKLLFFYQKYPILILKYPFRHIPLFRFEIMNKN